MCVPIQCSEALLRLLLFAASHKTLWKVLLWPCSLKFSYVIIIFDILALELEFKVTALYIR